MSLFTPAQLTSFWTDADQMNLSTRTRTALAEEGLTEPVDLAEFTKDGLTALFDNLRKPGKITTHPDGQVATRNNAVIVDQEPFKVPAKSKMRLLIALEAVKYYQMVSRDVTAATMMWPALKNFYEQWEALESRAKLDKPDVPKLNKGMPVPKWASNMEVFLRGIIGARTAPMAYLIRPEGAVATPAPALMPSQPHSAEHGSIEEELIARTSHNHALFRNDDGELYGLLQVALRGTPFESSIASGRKRREGRKSYNSVISQHAGRDVYEKLIREAELYLKTKTWDGRGGITLVKHTTRRRKSYLDLEDANYHVNAAAKQSFTSNVLVGFHYV